VFACQILAFFVGNKRRLISPAIARSDFRAPWS
jgi:hypothetical protein